MTCLKCGRTVPEGILLCADCRAVKIRTPLPMEISNEEQLQLTLSKVTKSRRRLKRLWVTALVLFLLSFAGLAGMGHLHIKEQAQITSLNTKVNSLETALDDRKKALEQQEAVMETLRSEDDRQKKELEAYEAYTGIKPESVLLISRTKAREETPVGE